MVQKLSFQKMHGAGNDFIVLDARTQGVNLSKEQAVHLCDRHLGIGCDTLVMLDAATVVTVGGEGVVNCTTAPNARLTEFCAMAQ